MNDEILKLLSNVINPATKKSLVEEDRFKNVEASSSDIVLIYQRDGISPVQKKDIELQIISALSGKYSEDKISVNTISENFSDIYNSINNGAAKESSQAKPQAKKSAQLEVGHAQPKAKERVKNVKKLIAVSSGKGGVGKSTVAVNLACSLNNLGKKVGLLDADIYGPSIPMLMGKRTAKPAANDSKRIVPIESHGINFISFGLFVDEKEPVIWRGPMLGGVLKQFLFDVDWGELDYLIIDLPPGTGDMQLSLTQTTEIDGIVVVSTPQDVALLDSTKGLKMFSQMKAPIIGMIENMSSFICDSCDKVHDIFGKGGVEKAALELEIPYLGDIPLTTELRTSADIGKPFMADQGNSKKDVWKSYTSIAKNIDDSLFGKKGKGIFEKLFTK
jgi:ATP-binding protein involved in chromosome partitioning